MSFWFSVLAICLAVEAVALMGFDENVRERKSPLQLTRYGDSILDQLSEDSNCHVEILSSPSKGKKSCWESIHGVRLLKWVGAPEEFEAWISIGFQVEWL